MKSFLAQNISFDIAPYQFKVQFKSGDTIFREGADPDCLYALLHGKVKTYKVHENGRISIIEFLKEPALIGEMELIHARDESIGVVALTDCTCDAIKIAPCREKLLSDALFLRFLCEYLGKKAADNSNRAAVNTAYPLSVRLAQFILLTQQNGLYREKHTEVAEYLGVTYRHLLYVLAEFVKRGILKKTTQGYVILDFVLLKAVASN